MTSKKPKTYYCNLCKKRHRFDSKKGKEHRRSANTKSANDKKSQIVFINSIGIKKKFPLLHNALNDMGMDNNITLGTKTIIKVNINNLKDTEVFFRSLKGKTNKQVLKTKKLLAILDGDEDEIDEDAIETFVMGEETYMKALKESHSKGKIADKVITNFFDGKYSEIYSY